MISPNVYKLVSTPPDDAVTVRLTKAGAYVEWNRGLEGMPTTGPHPVPAAINRAIDAMHHHRLGPIAVMLDDGAEWNPAWGTLLPPEG